MKGIRDPVSGKIYPDNLIRKAPLAYDLLVEQIKQGRVVLLDDGRVLRRGYTTGTCAAAASKAASLILACMSEVRSVDVITPVGVRVVLKVECATKKEGEGVACVRVDSGDYKHDTFNGLLICAKARRAAKLTIKAGKGIGIIKKEGFGGKIGMPDIYPHILKNIEENVKEALAAHSQKGMEIEIFVPEGEEVARKTILPELGIEGGIPIFGATGFVEPYTDDDYKHVIDFLIKDRKDMLGVSTGEKSKRLAVEKLKFPADKIVVAGNFVRYAVERSDAKRNVIFTMPAKLCDMLEVNPHEHFNFEFSSVGELVERLKREDYRQLKEFFGKLADELSIKTGAEVYVFDNSGELIGMSSSQTSTQQR
ncbi:hypothetical protein DRN79_01435 [Methanosarcinales archaeon]|nr:MAG: hypothetical protein DRN79_01435 [Methanosarcinales archaeon]